VIAQLHHDEQVKMHKLQKIYNGIDTSHYANRNTRQCMRAYLNIAENDLVFIIVANLIPYKGHKDLLQALHIIQQQLPPNWRLLCVGRDSGILAQLQTLAQQLNVAKNISWLGVREDIPDLLAAADIGVLCSHEEGFSNAILEGMAAGLPMVVTDVGGNAEAVINEQTGLVVPAKNSALLAQALLKLAQNTPLAKTMGMAAQTRVQQYFSLNACVAAYEKFYLCVV
jgi:glycosyltransferase involved in cell wall biosynthesis